MLYVFRDNQLLQSSIGRVVIKGYEYTSPPVAKIIAKHHLLRLVMKWGVVIPISWIITKIYTDL
jgi:hypothetical protein